MAKPVAWISGYSAGPHTGCLLWGAGSTRPAGSRGAEAAQPPGQTARQGSDLSSRRDSLPRCEGCSQPAVSRASSHVVCLKCQTEAVVSAGSPLPPTTQQGAVQGSGRLNPQQDPSNRHPLLRTPSGLAEMGRMHFIRVSPPLAACLLLAQVLPFCSELHTRDPEDTSATRLEREGDTRPSPLGFQTLKQLITAVLLSEVYRNPIRGLRVQTEVMLGQR